jgi:hypothetical protein
MERATEVGSAIAHGVSAHPIRAKDRRGYGTDDVSWALVLSRSTCATRALNITVRAWHWHLAQRDLRGACAIVA